LQHWSVEKPLLVPGDEPGYGSIPECPDLFFWNGWYYLLFGIRLHTHYRMARKLSGPWLCPAVDVLDNPMLAVMKTAPFGNRRRIGAGWVASRKGNLDNGETQWGGNVVFRELVQFADGSLGTRFPAEMIPAAGELVETAFSPLTPGCSIASRSSNNIKSIEIGTPETFEAGMLTGLPLNYHLSCLVHHISTSPRFGLGIRGEGNMVRQYELAFSPYKQQVMLEKEHLDCVVGLDQSFHLEIIVKGDLIDVCINHNRCIINRLPELQGDRLFFFCENGTVLFEQIKIRQFVDLSG
ncbi:MAG: hypothetical protein IH586_15495, partial [Anaerolineaceae bacterium]|nr:hypothetical protein [Anaerolineaceae bacterium]